MYIVYDCRHVKLIYSQRNKDCGSSSFGKQDLRKVTSELSENDSSIILKVYYFKGYVPLSSSANVCLELYIVILMNFTTCFKVSFPKKNL